MGSKFGELPKKEMGSFWQFVLGTSSNHQIKTKLLATRYNLYTMHKQKKEVLCFQLEIRKLADMRFNVDFCFEGIAIQIVSIRLLCRVCS